MNSKKRLQNWVRGWLPKEPHLPSLQRAADQSHVKSRRVRFSIGMVLFESLFVISFVVGFFEGNVTAVIWLWFSCLIGLFLALDFLVSRGRDLNEKLVAGLVLAVTNVGGIMVNFYIFSVPTNFLTRIFSLSVLALLNLPLIIALLAYVMGRKELSRKLVGRFSSRS